MRAPLWGIITLLTFPCAIHAGQKEDDLHSRQIPCFDGPGRPLVCDYVDDINAKFDKLMTLGRWNDEYKELCLELRETMSKMMRENKHLVILVDSEENIVNSIDVNYYFIDYSWTDKYFRFASPKKCPGDVYKKHSADHERLFPSPAIRRFRSHKNDVAPVVSTGNNFEVERDADDSRLPGYHDAGDHRERSFGGSGTSLETRPREDNSRRTEDTWGNGNHDYSWNTPDRSTGYHNAGNHRERSFGGSGTSMETRPSFKQYITRRTEDNWGNVESGSHDYSWNTPDRSTGERLSSLGRDDTEGFSRTWNDDQTNRNHHGGSHQTDDPTQLWGTGALPVQHGRYNDQIYSSRRIEDWKQPRTNDEDYLPSSGGFSDSQRPHQQQLHITSYGRESDPSYLWGAGIRPGGRQK